MNKKLTSKDYKKQVEISFEEYIPEYYETNIRRYLLNDVWSMKRIKDVMTMIKPNIGEKILDAGCGMGTFSIEAYKRGSEIYSMDYSPDAIKLAKKLSSFILGENKIKYVVGSVTNIPFPNDYFDKIISADVIEHISKRQFELFLGEAHRTLKNGGSMLLYTPNPPCKTNILKLLGYLPIFKNREFDRLSEEFYSKHCFPILDIEKITKDDEKYDYLHVDLKDPRYIKECLRRKGFKIEQIKCTRSSSKLQRLPFPFSIQWGGHSTFLARKTI